MVIIMVISQKYDQDYYCGCDCDYEAYVENENGAGDGNDNERRYGRHNHREKVDSYRGAFGTIGHAYDYGYCL